MIGCTSFTLTSKNQKHFLSRTMDFGMEMAQQVEFVPKNKATIINYTGEQKTTKYSYLGIGQRQQDHVILFDGINDQGLMGATLYFPRFATYNKKSDNEKDNPAPYHVISYILGEYSSLAEVEAAFKNKINILNQISPTIKKVPPLHFIFSDETGRSLIIEPQQDGLHIIDNSVGVMTNSPDYRWLETNLRNYLSVIPQQHEPVEFLGKKLDPFSQGSGTFGLPGDYTPVARFVRAAFLKHYTWQPKDEIEAITLSHHILEAESIPKGAVVTPDGGIDYTCYAAYMCAESHSFYYSTYNNQRIHRVQLDKLKDSTDYQTFKIDNSEDIKDVN